MHGVCSFIVLVNPCMLVDTIVFVIHESEGVPQEIRFEEEENIFEKNEKLLN